MIARRLNAAALGAGWEVRVGDVLDVLRAMPEGSVQMCATSPPYFGLRDYKLPPTDWPAVTYGTLGGEVAVEAMSCCLGLEPTPDAFVGHLVLVFREVRRVLRDDGTVWLNLGDSYSGAPKGNPGGSGKNGAYLGEHEGRYGKENLPGVKSKDLIGIPWMVAFALRADGWYLRSDIIWSKANPMPESVRDRCTRAHENVFAMSKKSRYFYDAEAIKEQAVGKNRHDLTGNGYSAPGQTVQSGNRKDLHGPTYSRHRSSVPDDQDLRKEPTGGRNKRSVWDVPEDVWSQFVRWLDEQPGGSGPDVWRVATQPFPDAHFAVFPEKLVEPMILAGSSLRACGECGAPWRRLSKTEIDDSRSLARQNIIEPQVTQNGDGSNARGSSTWGHYLKTTTIGWEPSCAHHDDSGRSVVLDPFAGACTTGLVALRHGREFIGVELNADYARMGRERILASMRPKPKKSRKREGATT